MHPGQRIDDKELMSLQANMETTPDVKAYKSNLDALEVIRRAYRSLPSSTMRRYGTSLASCMGHAISCTIADLVFTGNKVKDLEMLSKCRCSLPAL